MPVSGIALLTCRAGLAAVSGAPLSGTAGSAEGGGAAMLQMRPGGTYEQPTEAYVPTAPESTRRRGGVERMLCWHLQLLARLAARASRGAARTRPCRSLRVGTVIIELRIPSAGAHHEGGKGDTCVGCKCVHPEAVLTSGCGIGPVR